MSIAERIKQLRLLNEMTQEELAKKMGYSSKSAVSRTENATDDQMGQRRIAAFAKALNTTPAYLMGWTNNSDITEVHPDTMGYKEFDSEQIKELITSMKKDSNHGSDSNKTDYYIDDFTREAAQEIFENKELRLLFDAARDASPEDLRTVHQMLLALKRKEQNDY